MEPDQRAFFAWKLSTLSRWSFIGGFILSFVTTPYIADIAASILQKREGWLVENVHSFNPANPLVEWVNIALTLQFTDDDANPSDQVIKIVPELKAFKDFFAPDERPADVEENRPARTWRNSVPALTLLLRRKAELAIFVIPVFLWMLYYYLLGWLFSLRSLRRLARG